MLSDGIEVHKINSIMDVVDAAFFIEINESEHKYISSGNYYEWYYAITKYYQPKSILEIGVRYGYSLMSMIAGASELEVVRGWDIDQYVADSIDIARKNIKARINDSIDFEIENRNSQQYIELPQFFDLIHIDGDHSYNGKIHDLRLCLGKCKILVVDDYWHIDVVQKATNDFIKENYDKIKDIKILSSFRGTMVIEFIESIKTMHKKCWCGGDLDEFEHILYGQCKNCKTLVLKEQYTEQQLKEFYTIDGYWREHVKSLNYPTIEQRAINDFKDRIPVWYQILSKYKATPENLLEIGCMHGGFLYYCLQHGIQNVVGVEVDENTCVFARKRFNLPFVVSGLFPDVSLPFDEFDAVTGFDVVEHFLEPISALKQVANILKTDGICFFQTPCYRGEGKQWGQLKPEEHVFLYNAESIKQLFEVSGLEVIEILPGYFPDDMFVIGRKQQLYKNNIGNILLIRTDAIGDNVLAASMLPHIQEKYPDAKIMVLCRDKVANFYTACPFVKETISFDYLRAYQDNEYRLSILNQLHAINADIAINAAYSREALSDFFAINCNAKERISFIGNLSNISQELRDKNNQFYTKLLNSDGKCKTELDHYKDFLQGLGIFVSSLEAKIWTNTGDESFADDFFRQNNLMPEKMIAIFVGVGKPIGLYDHYGTALSQICKDNDFTVIALGSSQDYEINQKNLDDIIGVRTINLSGKTTLLQGAALLKRCRLAVGADTGLAHIACAVGTPNVIVLGGGHYGRFMPYSLLTSVVCLPLECYDCNWRCNYKKPHCVQDIIPEVITAAILQTLETPSEKPRVFVQDSSLWTHKQGEPKWKSCEQYLDKSRIQIIFVSSSSDMQTHDNIRQQVSVDLRKERKHLSESWLKVPPEFLEKAYSGDMGNVHRKLMESNLRNALLTEEEKTFFQHINSELTRRSTVDPVSAMNYLLAIMLYLPSGSLKIENAETSLPTWLIKDYVKFFYGGAIEQQTPLISEWGDAFYVKKKVLKSLQ